MENTEEKSRNEIVLNNGEKTVHKPSNRTMQKLVQKTAERYAIFGKTFRTTSNTLRCTLQLTLSEKVVGTLAVDEAIVWNNGAADWFTPSTICTAVRVVSQRNTTSSDFTLTLPLGFTYVGTANYSGKTNVEFKCMPYSVVVDNELFSGVDFMGVTLPERAAWEVENAQNLIAVPKCYLAYMLGGLVETTSQSSQHVVFNEAQWQRALDILYNNILPSIHRMDRVDKFVCRPFLKSSFLPLNKHSAVISVTFEMDVFRFNVE